MSEVTLTVVDDDRAIHGHAHGSHIDHVIAALAAEPETVEELAAAVARFVEPGHDRGFFAGFHAGASEEPWDAGIVIVDLAARIVAFASTYSWPRAEGVVWLHRSDGEEDVRIPYLLPGDWLFMDGVEQWRGRSSERRAERASKPPLDARAVLYGKAAEFIVDECLTAKAQGFKDPITEIHVRWMTTPREDLRGLTPREVILEKREHLVWDMQWREEQWSLAGACPPGLSPESAAYCYGGFGTHEIVVYYDLVRHLLVDCWSRVSQDEAIGRDEEVQRLERLKHEWLYAPQKEYDGKSPFYIIERERLRLPLALSAEESHHAFPDDDCPLCQMLREDSSFGPTFCHYDGCNMDSDFAFSFYQTREEWEEEQREWDEMSRKIEATRAVDAPDSTASASEREMTQDGIWKSSCSNPQALEGLSPSAAFEIRLFGIGGHLSELLLDLKADERCERIAAKLQRDWSNLLASLRAETPGLLQATLAQFCEDLAAIGAILPEVTDKSDDLLRDVAGLLDQLEEEYR